ILLLVCFCITPLAQQFTGTIRGTVLDSVGAVIPGAEVSVTNIGTNETRTLSTEDNGIYVITQFKPGLYRVSFKKSGFKSATVDEIKLDVQQIREVGVTLTVGQANETVTVTASGAATI